MHNILPIFLLIWDGGSIWAILKPKESIIQNWLHKGLVLQQIQTMGGCFAFCQKKKKNHIEIMW